MFFFLMNLLLILFKINECFFFGIRFEREKSRKVAAHRRSVLRKESEVLEFERKIREIENGLRQETEKMRATAAELSNLHKVR